MTVTTCFLRLHRRSQLVNATLLARIRARKVVCMTKIGRPGMSEASKAELWRRWKNGDSLREIGRALEKEAASIRCVLAPHGGIMPRERHRSLVALSMIEREGISRGLSSGRSVRGIAASISRSPSTVSREIIRHGGRNLYRAADADQNAQELARRKKVCKLSREPRLRAFVARRLSMNWSPEQIAGCLKLEFPDNPNMQISHETIYRSLFIQARGVLKKELIKHLRSRRTLRRTRHATNKGQARGRIVDAVSIKDRPAEVEDRAVPGHWEGDLLCGLSNTHIATLVERKSRYTMLVRVAGGDTRSVVKALSRKVRQLPIELRKSLTWDRGLEMAHHKRLTVATNVAVYFCDPQCPWQRGTNENTNGLLRQFLPRGTDLSKHSQRKLNAIALLLNQRPRKTLGFATPANILEKSLR